MKLNRKERNRQKRFQKKMEVEQLMFSTVINRVVSDIVKQKREEQLKRQKKYTENVLKQFTE